MVSVSLNSSSLSAEGVRRGQASMSHQESKGQIKRAVGGGLTCAGLPLHGPHQVVGPLLAVQRLQQVKHIIVKHEVDQVEGPWVANRRSASPTSQGDVQRSK